ncbi:hypothetical protein [Candidatus Protochlamydia phocaeensis]|nr:hypothetical protein [Candidatus Protochlamydia phocaeensis]
MKTAYLPEFGNARRLFEREPKQACLVPTDEHIQVTQTLLNLSLLDG